MIKAPPGPPRKDRDLSHVIISETKDKAVAKHQVKKFLHSLLFTLYFFFSVWDHRKSAPVKMYRLCLLMYNVVYTRILMAKSRIWNSKYQNWDFSCRTHCQNVFVLVVVVSSVIHWFWAISAALGSVRWWCLRSWCTVLSHVVRGHPGCLLQSARGEANRIFLASALSSMCSMCPELVVATGL